MSGSGTRSPLRNRPTPARRPAQSLGERLNLESAELFYGSGVAITLAVAGLIVLILPSAIPIWAIGVLMISAGAGIGVVVGRRAVRRIPPIAKGIAGEVDVASSLRRIERLGCRVAHDVPSQREGGANADHVVVSPVGVFVIETKYRSKRDGQRESISFDGSSIRVGTRPPDAKPVRQAAAIAGELGGRIGERVQPVVVFPGWWVNVDDRRSFDHSVWVLNPDDFVSRLEREIRASASPAIDVDRLAAELERFRG